MSLAPSGVEKVSFVQNVTHRPYRRRACHEIRCHLLAPQIEIAVLEPSALVGIKPLIDLEREGRSRRQHLEIGNTHLYVPRHHIRVALARFALTHDPAHHDAVFASEATQRLG
jgi:hypothetical protein